MLRVKEKSKNGIKNPLMTITAFLMLFVAFNPDLGGTSIIWWSCVGTFILAFVFCARNLYFNAGYTIWLVVFTAFCAMSILWAISTSLVVEALKNMLVHTIVLIIFASLIRTKDDLVYLFKILVVVCVFNAIYLVFTNLDLIFSSSGDRLGTKGDWNANSIGMIMAIASLLLVYLTKEEQNKTKRIINYIFVVLLVFISLITGSRKAFFIVIGGIGLFLLLTAQKNKKIILFIAIIVSSVLLYELIMKVPYFYSILGWRIESMFAIFSGEGQVDSSTEMRQLYAKAAIDVFRDEPLVGCGLDCFRLLNVKITGKRMYAHNNYAELLADLGIIGAMIYYSGYVVLLKGFLVTFKQDTISKLMIVLLALLFVSDFGAVSYNSLLFKIIILVGFSWLDMCKKKLER